MNRYEEYLNEEIDLKDFSKEEDDLLIQNYGKFAKNWDSYGDVLPNRSTRKIKKRFFLLLRAKKITINNSFSLCGNSTINEDSNLSSFENEINAQIPKFDFFA